MDHVMPPLPPEAVKRLSVSLTPFLGRDIGPALNAEIAEACRRFMIREGYWPFNAYCTFDADGGFAYREREAAA